MAFLPFLLLSSGGAKQKMQERQAPATGRTISSRETPVLSTPFRLQLPCRLYEEMLQHARAEYPNECCGLLAGQLAVVGSSVPIGRVTKRYPLINELGSPTEYQSEPRSILRAEKDMRQGGLE